MATTETTITPSDTTEPPALTTLDRCDRCGARAKTRAVLLSGGELLFCGHHTREHQPALLEVGVTALTDVDI